MNGDTWAWLPSKQIRSDIRRGDKIFRVHTERVAVEWELRRGETFRRTADNAKVPKKVDPRYLPNLLKLFGGTE